MTLREVVLIRLAPLHRFGWLALLILPFILTAGACGQGGGGGGSGY
jgi:hypothetical protein